MIISKESINYSLRSIEKRKMRSFLTVLSIFLGIATIFIFISFGWGLYDYIDQYTTGSSADKVVVQAKGLGFVGDGSFKLTESDLRAVEKTQGVYEVDGIYSKAAEVIKDGQRIYTFLMGYDPDKSLIMELFNIDYEAGRGLTKSDTGRVVLGYNYMVPDKIFSRQVRLNDKINIQGQDLRVVGFFESVGSPPDDAQIYVIEDMVDNLYPEENNSYMMIVARVDPKNIDRVVKDIEENLLRSRNLKEGKEDFFVQSFSDMLDSYSGALDLVIGFIILIALISIIVSAVNTANTMISSVLERFQEIGVLKAIGAKNSEVFKIFLFESGFLGFVAGIIGVVLGWRLAEIGAKILLDLGWGFLQPRYSWVLFVGCVIFSTLTGAISGVAPAIRASKINAVDALRYE